MNSQSVLAASFSAAKNGAFRDSERLPQRRKYSSHRDRAESRTPAGSPVCYSIARFLMRVVLSMTIRIRTQSVDAATPPGGYLLACSHVSHLDPFCLSAVLPERVNWMSRIEFFRRRWTAGFLRLMGVFPVHRQGVPVSAIRTALARLEAGQIVGLFVEGEIKTGADSVLRGGGIKRGVCLLAARSGRPVVPCVIVGTDKLNHPGPWMPYLRGQLWVIRGEPILPVVGADRRAARAEMAAVIERALVGLYAELRRSFDLPENIVP